MLVSSVPLSETTVVGLPRCRIRASSSRVTRRPDSEVSATSARHSRLKSSTTARTRNRRPSVKASDTKSRLQRSFGPSGSKHRPSGAQGPLPAATLAHLQLLLAVKPPELLLVHDDPLPFQHEVDAPVAEPAAFSGDLLHGVPQSSIVRPDAPVSDARPVDLQNLARPALAHPVRVHR